MGARLKYYNIIIATLASSPALNAIAIALRAGDEANVMLHSSVVQGTMAHSNDNPVWCVVSSATL